tara:strand:- start:373 stop:567 length:195 start_codon:yes stop_codon:yes gene_type:complete
MKKKNNVDNATLSENPRHKYRTVALLLKDYAFLREIADDEQRSMARQLSVIIRKEYESLHGKAI